MELKWLEDFLSLAETRSFSLSSRARNVTQSAFSRRIRSLEVWLGTELFNRRTYPITLTDDGHSFRETAEEIVRLMYQSRAALIGRADQFRGPSIAIAALHTLTITFLPRWLNSIRMLAGDIPTKVLPDNYAICVQALAEGGYDLMLTFHHPSIPVPLDPARFPFQTVGTDALVAIADTQRLEQWRSQGDRLPMLQYSKGSFLGLMTSLAQGQIGAPETYIAHVNENSMAEAMKFMVLEGHGIAWLPRALVQTEIASGKLTVVAPELPMEIRLYRNRDRARILVERVWAAAAQNYAKME